MKDPLRWREANSEAEADVRALLASHEAEAPSPSERKRIWSGLLPRIQHLPAPPPVTPAAPIAATGTAALVTKVSLGVALVTAVGAGVYVARSRPDAVAPVPTRSVPSPGAPPEIPKPVIPPTLEPATMAGKPVLERPKSRRPKTSPPVPTPAKPAEAPEPETVASVSVVVSNELLQEDRRLSRTRAPAPAQTVGPQKSAIVAPAPVVVSNELLQEGRRLSRARAALRAHDPETALALLQAGSGATAGLAEEREALTIEALWLRPSSRGEAQLRARAFMTAYPDSPYRARIRALVLANQ